MRTDWALIASLVLTLAPAAAAKGQKAHGPAVAGVSLDGWLEVRGPTFTLISNAGCHLISTTRRLSDHRTQPRR